MTGLQSFANSGPPECYLGVDGGGSKTLAIIVDGNGQELGRGQAGSSNYQAVGLLQAVRQIYAAVEQAAQAIRCTLPLRKAWLGLAGLDRPLDYQTLHPHLKPLAEIVHLTNDSELALSALDGASGVALIAGTGSITLGRDKHGKTARAGGWGHILGDEGSGYDLGRQALQAAVRSADGRGPHTSLLRHILNYWHLESAEELLSKVYGSNDKANIASLAGCVFLAAREDDEVARTIIQRAAGELALAVKTVSAALDFAEEAQKRVPLALSGGLLLHETDFRLLVLNSIHCSLATGQIVLVENPALSAARGARELTEA